MNVRYALAARWSGQRLAAIALVAAVAATASGCSQVAVAPVGNCSPEYSVGSTEGGLHVRQEGRGQAIAWGIYTEAKYKTGTDWVVTVYADGTKIDAKKQGYEPHGSVNKDRALKYSGIILEITGTATHGGDVLKFSGKCYIA